MTSPRSVWEDNLLNGRSDSTASPRHKVTLNSRLVSLSHTALPSDRQYIHYPAPQTKSQFNSSHKRRSPFSYPHEEVTDCASNATKRPRLAYRELPKWRQELSSQDRAKTRERIMLSLHMNSQGNFEKLVLLLSSMEEELLHIKSTSNKVYEYQATELGNLIKHASLEC
ncbi:hypothetical protein CCR75_007418 [Bremia lactucae]|uniref:Uncharacterized protein n=1 Tax=Bremia lactucae TaxID=4779 RepID=A0A976NYU9_BRELC|nr:hypothetical protein CCR75_007418 [Bremia lactucae]